MVGDGQMNSIFSILEKSTFFTSDAITNYNLSILFRIYLFTDISEKKQKKKDPN